MPRSKTPPSLVTLTSEVTSRLLRSSLIVLESTWRPRPRVRSPRAKVSPVNCAAIISPEEEEMREYENAVRRWKGQHHKLREVLVQMPANLAEEVLNKTLELIEKQLTEDKDRKLIMALLNIEKLKISDLFFGVHSLLECLADTNITNINFPTKLWLCLFEYAQIVSSSVMQCHICEVIPRLTNLTSINLSYFANDKTCFQLARYMPQLEELTLDHSSVTDKSMKFLCGMRPPPTGNEAESATVEEPFGIFKLKFLSIQACREISASAVWVVLLKLPDLTMVKYHENFTMAEVISKECSLMTEAELQVTNLKLSQFNHPFPYSLTLFEELLGKVIRICPYITALEIVTTDNCLAGYVEMKHLRRVCIEVEDCFGLGLEQFLDSLGHQIEDLSISCSSDADSTSLPEGGSAYQLFNIGLKLVRLYCYKELKRLNIAGCGLVSNYLVDKLKDEDVIKQKGGLHNLSSLKSLILLSYEEDNPVQTCEEKTLLEVLHVCPKIRDVSLEGNFSSFLDDKFLDKVMARNCLERLEVFDVQGSKVRLTMKSAERLLTLPHLAEWRLSKWSLTEDEVGKIKETVVKNGWDVWFRV